MKPRLALTISLLLVPAAAMPARAACSNNFTIRPAGQLPDFTFTSGVPRTIRYNPHYVSFASTDYSCGIYARSTVPGLSVQQTYGCPGTGCAVGAPGTWVAVGDAYPTFFGTVTQKGTDIPLIFDGTAPAGTYGTLDIGIASSDVGGEIFVIAKTNVYVEGATSIPTWFGTSSNSANATGDRMVLDHPYLNGNPNANLFVTHVRNPGGSISGTSWNHPIGVTYDPGTARWAVRNLDGTAMPTGLGFGLRYDPTAELHCTPDVPGTFYTIGVNNPAGNNNVYATVIATPIDGAPWPYAVRYVAPYWQIVHSNGAAIPRGTCFNVKVFAFTQYLDNPANGDLSGHTNVTVNWGTGVDAGGNGTGHTSGASRVLQFPWALDNPFRQVIVTPNATPLGWPPYYDLRYFGTSAPRNTQAGTRWSVYGEDGLNMPLATRFNVWAPCAGPTWYPDADGDGWGGEGTILASCTPLAGYASRSGDCDDADATRFPGSAERNDGLDNSCPGTDGWGVVDEITGKIEFSDKSNFCWGFQSGANGYDVARSSAPSFASCGILIETTSTCGADFEDPPAGGVFHYLVRSSGPWTGSWGIDSAGSARGAACP